MRYIMKKLLTIIFVVIMVSGCSSKTYVTYESDTYNSKFRKIYEVQDEVKQESIDRLSKELLIKTIECDYYKWRGDRYLNMLTNM